jgi:3-hydroxyacyl-CoA dehydrogenase
MAKNIETAAVIGAGKIGVCWSALFAARGHEVRLHDVREGFEKSAKRLSFKARLGRPPMM